MTGDQLHLRTPDGTAVTLEVSTPVPAPRAAAATGPLELAGAAQTGGPGTSTTAPELLVPGETTTTTAAPASAGGDDGLSFDARVNLVVGALIALAVIVAVMTFFYWRHTRPERLDAAAPDRDDEGDEPTRLVPAAGAGARTSTGRASVFDAPSAAPSSARSPKPSSAEELFGPGSSASTVDDDRPDAAAAPGEEVTARPTSPEAEAARRSAGAKDPTRMIRRPVVANEDAADPGAGGAEGAGDGPGTGGAEGAATAGAGAGAGGAKATDAADAGDGPDAGDAAAAGDGPGVGGATRAAEGADAGPGAGGAEGAAAGEPGDEPPGGGAPGAVDGAVPPLGSVDEPTRALGERPPGDLLDPGPAPLVTLEDLEAGRAGRSEGPGEAGGTNGRRGDHADAGSEPPERR